MGTRQNLVHFADKTLAGVPALLTDLQKLVDDRDTSDVIFLVGKDEAEFHAHRLILQTRCSRFKAMQPPYRVSMATQASLTIRYRTLDAESFREVLTYIYSGKLILVDARVFSVLAVAQELGVRELEHHCEEHILGTLSANNACTFYASARRRHNNEFEVEGDSFTAMCASFIEENAEACVKTESWLRLTQDDICTLLSSDMFSLEEEEVWRAVLAWAKSNSGVSLDKPAAAWDEREKEAVCKKLSGVIHAVKLLLIDSQVFAEEVEPTGAVPMEMSLERYRFAAVPTSYSRGEDKRLCPRVSHKLFAGSDILTGDKLQYQRLLNTWYGEGKQTWRLLYRASRDGFTADSFHRHCDGHAHTFTILIGTTGSVCGGYVDVPWSSNAPTRGRFVPSHRAFLFTLVNHQGVPPSRFDVKTPKFATIHHPLYGPMFGAGADLCVANSCRAGMQCYSNLPHTYDGPHASPAILMGDFNFNVRDYEVFTVTESVENVV